MTDYLMHGRSDSKPRKTRRIASERRRLTLGAIEPNKPSADAPGMPNLNDSGGLIAFLKSTPIQNIVRSQKRKICYSSMTVSRTSRTSSEGRRGRFVIGV